MRKIIPVIVCFFSGFFLFSQEIEQNQRRIPVENSALNRDLPSEIFDISPLSTRSGPFDVRRYMIPITIMDIDVSLANPKTVDFLSMSAAKEHYKKSLVRESEAPERQIKQIKSQIKVFNRQQKENWNESDKKLHFQPRVSPYNRRWDRTFHPSGRYDFHRRLYNPGYFNRPYRGIY